MNVGDKCCFLSQHPGTKKLMWLVGVIRHIAAPGVYAVKVRKDYLPMIEPNDTAMVTEPWIFADWGEASNRLEEADKLLTKALHAYDGNWDWEKERLSVSPPARAVESSAEA